MEGRLLARARARQETLRAANRAEEDRRRRKITAKIPEIGRIDTALRANLSEMVRVAMRQSARTAPAHGRAAAAESAPQRTGEDDRRRLENILKNIGG